ncbi:hypothetical protein [Vibrio sp. TBV020]|uniref:hypothetical protein n=1 Tax=Vibrio sp. TBV020 TaxID=3137398 RepID=UPI0038CD65ED
MKNVAPETSPQTFHIYPEGGEGILLHGWQRAYAEFDVQWQVHNHIDTLRIRQVMYEATDHSWLLVETVTQGNVAKGYQRCQAWHFANKSCVKGAPFIHRQYLRELFGACGIPYQVVVGEAS